jgi:hypothetical protein
MADDHDRSAAQASRAGDESGVVGEEAVAVQFDVLLEDGADVVQGVWPLGMTGELDPLPGGQAGRGGRAVGRREPSRAV